MDNKELHQICSDLTRRVSNEEEFNEELKKLGVNRRASVIWDSTGSMAMGMIFGMDGKVLSF